MTKRKFLAKLESALSSLVNEERNRQLDYYEEMIDDMIEEGMSEEAAVERLGSVQGVAAKILGEVSPDMLKKKKSPLTKILIAVAIILAVVIVGIVVLFGIFDFDHNSTVQQIDNIDDMIEDRLELSDGWVLGGDTKFDVNGIRSVDVVWSCGNVVIDEAEGSQIVINAGKAEALEYQIKDGVLYISNTEECANEKSKLEILIPEDAMFFDSLSVVTSAGDVYVDCENLGKVDVVTASGNISVAENEAIEMSFVSASGNILINSDDEDSFALDYATDSGKVSVSFDRTFKNESVDGKEASYDHSFGNKNCRQISAVTSTGDIKLIDD